MGLLPSRPAPSRRGEYCFSKWRDDGTDQTIHDLLRSQVRESGAADPSLVVLDTQSLHAAAGCPPTPPEGARQKGSQGSSGRTAETP